MKKGKVLFFISCMSGGGADRVASLLSNEFYKNGYEVEMIITSMKKSDMGHTDLIDEIPMSFLADSIKKKKITMREAISSVMCKPIEAVGRQVPAYFAFLSFKAQYRQEILLIRSILKKNPDAIAIAFLQPSIPMLMLAAEGLPNKVIFSERGDPFRLMKHRYGRNFISKYYARADAAVFQTIDALNAYPESIGARGKVIINPLKTDLPNAYHGKRNKNITTFCRISKQKNLPLLLESFNMFYHEYSDYTLRIIGDVLNKEGASVKEQLDEYIIDNGLENSVIFEPFNANVHEDIINDAMYVNSSDYEGISNAMLEAMAIGMPSVCTDCPIGGARATITDGENGLLVSVGDAEALYKAMKRVIEEDGLGEKLSIGGEKLREELSLKKTVEKWMKLL